MPMHPVHVDHRERGEGWTWSTMDPALGPWTVNLRPPWTTPVDHSPVRAHDYDVAEPQHATCPGRPDLDRPNPSPVRTQPVLTVDWSPLTVDLTPHVGDTDTLDPHVRC